MSRIQAALRVKEHQREKHRDGATQIWATSPVSEEWRRASSIETKPFRPVGGPTNPLKPHQNLPFKPDRSPSQSPSPPPERIGARSKRNKSTERTTLVLDSVSRAGGPASRSPDKKDKASARSSARGAGSQRTASQRNRQDGKSGKLTPPSSKAGNGKAKKAGASASGASDATSSASPAAGGATESFKRAERASNEHSEEMRALLKLDLTATELDRVADGFDAVAAAKEAVVGKDSSLPVVLGGVLMRKIDEGKKGTQEFFRELDANGGTPQ